MACVTFTSDRRGHLGSLLLLPDGAIEAFGIGKEVVEGKWGRISTTGGYRRGRTGR